MFRKRLLNSKVRVVISDRLFNVFSFKNPDLRCFTTSHLCLKSPTFRYIKKHERLEARGTLIPFDYSSNDIRSICHNHSPVTIEVIQKKIMVPLLYNEDKLRQITKGNLALFNAGRVHVYGAE